MVFFYHGVTAPDGSRPPHYRGFMIVLRHITTIGAPLDEWSARCRDVSLTKVIFTVDKIHAPGGIRTQISAGERLQIYAIDSAATGTGMVQIS